MRARRLAAIVVLLGIVCAGSFAVTALGRQSADSPLIVVDQSIGGVALGMTQSQVEALYGAPDDSMLVALHGGGTGLLVRYRVHGGVLIVVYADGKVVSVETTSSFHKTKGGAGAGAPISKVNGFEEDYCSGGLWDGGSATAPDAVVTVFVRNSDEIGSVIITQLAYYDLCDSTGPGQEVPEPGPGEGPGPASYPLQVMVVEEGGGWVRSSPYEIDCPEVCSGPFDRGVTISFEAHPTSGFTFEGWEGDCKGKGACVVTMDGPKKIVARFSGHYVPPPPPPKGPQPKPPKTGATGPTGVTGPP